MNANETSESKKSRTLSSQVVAAIIGIVAFLGPVAGQYSYWRGGSQLSIMSMMWQYYPDPWMPFGGFMIAPFLLLTGLLIGTLRPVFAYMMYRLYNEKTTKKRAVIVGIAAELQFEVIFLISFLPMILFNPYPGEIYFPIMFPIPLLILVGLAIIKVFPPKVNESWVEQEETKHWWEKPEDKPDAPAVVEDAVSTPKGAEDPIPEPEDDWLKEN